jgi:hypothetical protein
MLLMGLTADRYLQGEGIGNRGFVAQAQWGFGQRGP